MMLYPNPLRKKNSILSVPDTPTTQQQNTAPAQIQNPSLPEQQQTTPTQTSSTRKIAVSMYAMSQCPYAVVAQASMLQVLQKIAGYIDFSLEFIGRDNVGTLVSLHGEQEIEGDRIQLCAQKIHPNRFMELVVCMNQDQQQIPENWEECAQSLSLTTLLIKLCARADLSLSMLRESFQIAFQQNVRGSPTIFVAGKIYQGMRTTEALLQAICGAFGADAPSPCADVPNPVNVPVTIISDKRCRKCQTSLWVDRLRDLFPAAQIRLLDYSDDQGKQLYQDLNLTFLPAILVGHEVRHTVSYSKLKRYLIPTGDFLALYVGTKHNPTREICHNGQDDTNNGLTDCQDPDCQTSLVCREEIHNRLDLFVMSKCPFGVQALAVLPEVLHNFGDRITLQVHYLAHGDKTGFKALHGPTEVDENIRQLCAIDCYGHQQKYFDYINCRGRNNSSEDWRACTGINGIDAAAIQNCVEHRGPDLLATDIRLAKELGFRASPTWLVNNRHTFRRLDANAIIQNLCKWNRSLPNCDKEVTTPACDKEGESCQ